MELSDVKWFKVYEESLNIEDQNKNVKMKIEGENSGGKAKDFSSGPEVIKMASTSDQDYGQFLSRLDEPEIRKQLSGKNIYEVTIKNVGGLVMPVTIEWLFKDGSSEIDKLPAEIWRLNEYEIQKTFVKDKEVTQVNLDPNFEFADTDMNNNTFPKKEEPSDFDKFKSKN
jgi:hypothetical protein